MIPQLSGYLSFLPRFLFFLINDLYRRTDNPSNPPADKCFLCHHPLPPLYVAALATSDNIQLILRKVFWENFLPRSRIRCRPCRSGAAARGIVGLNKYTN